MLLIGCRLLVGVNALTGGEKRNSRTASAATMADAHAQSDVNKIDRFLKRGEEILDTFTVSIRQFEGHALKIKDLSSSVEQIKADLKKKADCQPVREAADNSRSTSSCGQPEGLTTATKRRRVTESCSQPEDDATAPKQKRTTGSSCQPVVEATATVSPDFTSHESDTDDDVADDDVADDDVAAILTTPDVKQSSGDTFFEEIDDFFVEEQTLGAPVKETVARVVNKSLRPRKVDTEKIKVMHEKYLRPENLDCLQVPRVDNFLWGQLSTETKAADVTKQKFIGHLNQSAAPLIKAMDHLCENSQPDIAILKECIADSFKGMCASMNTINQQRREHIQKELDPKFKKICAESQVSAAGLFGDNLSDQSKQLDSAKEIKMTTKGKQPFLGQRRGGAQHKGNPPPQRTFSANPPQRTFSANRPPYKSSHQYRKNTTQFSGAHQYQKQHYGPQQRNLGKQRRGR